MTPIGKSNSIKLSYLRDNHTATGRFKQDVRHERYRTPQLYRRPHPQLREGKGWTQQMLGNKLGKKTSTISAYETNAKLPSVDCLIEMADLLGVSLDTLVYGENADLLSVHTLTQEQKKIVTAIVQAFEDTSSNAKNTDQRLRLVAEVVRLLAK